MRDAKSLSTSGGIPNSSATCAIANHISLASASSRITRIRRSRAYTSRLYAMFILKLGAHWDCRGKASLVKMHRCILSSTSPRMRPLGAVVMRVLTSFRTLLEFIILRGLSTKGVFRCEAFRRDKTRYCRSLSICAYWTISRAICRRSCTRLLYSMLFSTAVRSGNDRKYLFRRTRSITRLLLPASSFTILVAPFFTIPAHFLKKLVGNFFAGPIKKSNPMPSCRPIYSCLKK
jgi:hypothetical protein